MAELCKHVDHRGTRLRTSKLKTQHHKTGILWLILLASTVFITQPARAIKVIKIKTARQAQCLAVFNFSPIRSLDSYSQPVEYEALGAPWFRDTLRAKGPFGQAMAVSLQPGYPAVYGTRRGVDRFRKDLGELKDVIFDFSLVNGKDKLYYDLPGKSDSAVVEIAPALTGSALLHKNYSDLDAEITLVVRSRDFKIEDFYDPQSDTVNTVVQYLKDSIQTNLEKGYKFSDFKAGEYDFIPSAAQETKSKAIKWSYEEIMEGFKMVPQGHEKGPLKRLTLEEAIATQSRIKVDWVAKIETTSTILESTGIKERHIEVSVLFMLAGAKLNGTPVLKINNQTQFPAAGATGAYIGTKGSSSHLPVRITSAFFEGKHVQLARQASVSTPPPDIRYLNTVIINAVHTYFGKRDYLKILKVLSTRLYYWNDYQYFKYDHPVRGVTTNSSELLQVMERIINDPIVVDLKGLLETGKGFELLPIEQISPTELKQFFKGVSRFLNHHNLMEKAVVFHSVKDANTVLSDTLSAIVFQQIAQFPNLRDYITYIVNLAETQRYEHYSDKATFLTFAIPDAFRVRYSKLFPQLVEQYPSLTITRPEDLHMTIAFFGELPVSKEKELKKITDHYNRKLSRFRIPLTEGSLQIVGRN
ncbi:MAG: hypothetical protein KDD50_09065, partial [Bdellovibrionales bacterium]|nr:hypothetical protein [Bdellovibrionales bacterium]